MPAVESKAKPKSKTSSILDEVLGKKSEAKEESIGFDLSKFDTYFDGQKSPATPYILLGLSILCIFVASQTGNAVVKGDVTTYVFAPLGAIAGLMLSPVRMSNKDTLRSADTKKPEANLRATIGLIIMGILPIIMNYLDSGSGKYQSRLHFMVLGWLTGYTIGHVSNSIKYESLGSQYTPLKFPVIYNAIILAFSILNVIGSFVSKGSLRMGWRSSRNSNKKRKRNH